MKRVTVSQSPDMDIWRQNVNKLHRKELLTKEEEDIILGITKKLPS